METLEQIADKVGRETDEYLSDKIAAPEEWKRIRDIEFSRRLVAELAKQEPVCWQIDFVDKEETSVITWDRRSMKAYADTGAKVTPLYAAPLPTPEDVRDAAKWREHEAKKKALIERGFLKSPLRDAAMTAAQEGK